ncbi:flavodoxin family protein [Bordetella sp. N]|uniref:flavodoxin family protein n=1 Tax=Bordetella sp. N TaxID=1746199 RepID=UPI00070B5D20|nr:NAD(P)H-dependent oxidoreductase [Bordetella sp. N]ALM83971.1 hypothetical protein ASB57_14215 [Bordetella sp. N]
MNNAPLLLIVWHSRTGAAQAMAQAAADGARDVATWAANEQAAEPAQPGTKPGSSAATGAAGDNVLRVSLMQADDVRIDDLLESDAYLFCAPENLGSLSGAMKEFFDRCYYGALDADGGSLIGGRPYGLMISAGSDGSGAARQAERICTGWRLRQAAAPLIARNGAQTPSQILAPKIVAPAILQDCKDLGGLLAGLLLMGS